MKTDHQCLPPWMVRLIPQDHQQAITGDLEECYLSMMQRRGRLSARVWLAIQIFRLMPALLGLKFGTAMDLFTMDWKAAWRRLRQQRSFVLINVLGLCLGLTVGVFVALWIQDEMGWNSHFPHADRICRVISVNGQDRAPVGPGPLSNYLKDEIPEIVAATRFHGTSGLFTYGDRSLRLDGLRAEPSFFDVFGWPVSQGDREGAIDEIGDFVLTEEAARRFFDNEAAVDKVLKVERRWTARINAVIPDAPRRTTPRLKFDYLEPFALYHRLRHPGPDSWEGSSDYNIYVRLNETARLEDVNAKIEALIRRHDTRRDSHVILEPLRDVHLRASCTRWDGPHGDIRLIWLYGTAAVLVLMLAVINYINLSTARAITRRRELTYRKITGASTVCLARQALLEALATAWLAGLFSVLMLMLVLPQFNHWTGMSLKWGQIPMGNWLIFAVSVTIVGLMSCIYPAIILIRYSQPKQTLSLVSKAPASLFRTWLLQGQFVLTIAILSSAWAVMQQMNAIDNHQPGYDARNVLIQSLGGEYPQNTYESFRSDVLKSPAVEAMGSCVHVPDNDNMYSLVSWESNGQKREMGLATYQVDENYLDIYKIELLKGRFFEHGRSDNMGSVVINESAAHLLGMDNPLGHPIRVYDRTGIITGIVRDFNYMPLHHPVQPLFMIYTAMGDHLELRSEAGRMDEARAWLETCFRRHYPDLPWEPVPFENRLAGRYTGERLLEYRLTFLGAVALLLSVLGLYGLASFIMARRQREISLRKVLGAAPATLCWLFIKSFLKWILLAALIAWPLSMGYIGQWQMRFALHAPAAWWAVPVVTVITILMTLLAVLGQVLRAVSSSPADVLRHE